MDKEKKVRCPSCKYPGAKKVANSLGLPIIYCKACENVYLEKDEGVTGMALMQKE